MRHLGVFIPKPAASLLGLHVDRGALSKSSLRLELRCPSAYLRSKSPFFHFPLEKASGKLCPAFRKSHPRVWLPSRCVFQLFNPKGASFSSQRSWGFSLQSLSPLEMIGSEFPPPPPLLRFSGKRFSLPSALQRFDPTSEAVPLFATRVFRPGRGLSALLSLFTSRVVFASSLPEKRLPFPVPFSFLGLKSLAAHPTPNLKVSLSKRLASPLVRGAGPSGVSHLPSLTTCSKPNRLRTIFSSRSPEPPRDNPGFLS